MTVWSMDTILDSFPVEYHPATEYAIRRYVMLKIDEARSAMSEIRIEEYVRAVKENGELKELMSAVQGERDHFRAIARELAAKHVRGTKACSACGAVAYMGTLAHNEGCAVQRLEALKCFIG